VETKQKSNVFLINQMLVLYNIIRPLDHKLLDRRVDPIARSGINDPNGRDDQMWREAAIDSGVRL